MQALLAMSNLSFTFALVEKQAMESFVQQPVLLKSQRLANRREELLTHENFIDFLQLFDKVNIKRWHFYERRIFIRSRRNPELIRTRCIIGIKDC